ncbi:MAG TPA: universal stress protein [Solirubrobacterales bacterium]|nr:universal stress protein [Solirubrobacterales bacterium]
MRDISSARELAEGRGSAAAFRRIVVGFNERPASRDAVVLAKALSDPDRTDLIVASVRPYWPDLLGREGYRNVVAEDEAWLSRETEKAVGSRPFSTRVVAGGHESGGLKEVAAAEGADLIVVGSTHRGLLGRVMPGTVGERVLDNAPCAVAVAPLGLAEQGLEISTIAVAFDGSNEASVALHLGFELAAQAGARLLVLGAVDLNPDLSGLQTVSPELLDEARMQRHLGEAQKGAPEGVSVETRLLHGAPNHVLPQAAEAADLLILGSRGHYGRARRLFMGSVATQVTRHAPCATLITPSA